MDNINQSIKSPINFKIPNKNQAVEMKFLTVVFLLIHFIYSYQWTCRALALGGGADRGAYEAGNSFQNLYS